MQDQLDALAELQQVDLLVQKLEIELEDIPRKVQELRNDVERVRELLERERVELEGADRMRREGEHDVHVQAELLAKARGKAGAAIKAREHDAAQREIEAMRKASGDRQEEVLKLMEAIEQFNASIRQHEEEFEAIQKVLEGEEAAAEARMTELRAKKASHDGARNRAVAKLRPDVVRRYEAIKRKRGVATVEAADGQCRGCHIQLPPQLYNTLLRLESIEMCPNCNRILFYKGPVRHNTGKPQTGKHA